MPKIRLVIIRSIFLYLFICYGIHPTHAADSADTQRWLKQAGNITIVRDDWGIAHVTGKTDSDAVFGMIYAQAEDDFNRVETNYITSLGRTAEVEGETAIWRDLRQKLFIQPDLLKKDFDESPGWLQKLMIAWADGLNFYLATHPSIKPKLITKFEPWMALSFTEGSIGGDIETINLGRLQAFYGSASQPVEMNDAESDDNEPRGSNGIAIAPKNTANKRSLLLINPHTSFFFRSELQMKSSEGLNAYGAVTWGQFFIYQGFNERLGWMHTSSAADAIDLYNETVSQKAGRYFYKYGAEDKPMMTSVVRIPFKTVSGISERVFTVYRTHHGPIVRKAADGRWESISLMHEPIKALMQSYGRTKAKNLAEFKKVMNLKANSSNNTLYADADGNIAYFHVNYVPRREPKFNWRVPVDGSDPAADHKGIHDFSELPHLINPESGWVYNSNDWPWSAAGISSLKRSDFPAYVDAGSESARGRHAVMVLKDKRNFTLDSLRDAAYDSYLPWFDKPIPALVRAWDSISASDVLKARTSEQIGVLRKWDLRWSVDSVATALAIHWAEEAQRRLSAEAARSGMQTTDYISEKATATQLLEALSAASERLAADFGKWQTPWGEINRFQRLTGDIVHPFDDKAASIPVGFTSGNWGSLASFGARPTRNTKKWYGTSGNSFVAVVEFGKSVRAKAVTAGGESGDPKSKHFNDQAQRYSTGDLRDIYFYPSQLKGRTERTYRPGK